MLYPASAYRLRRMFPVTARRFLTAVAFAIGFLLLLSRFFAFYPGVLEGARNVPAALLSLYQRDSVKIVKRAMPVLAWSSFEGDAGTLTPSRLFWEVMGFAGRVKLHSPEAVLQSQIPLLAAVDPPGTEAIRPEASDPGVSVPSKAVTALTGDCLVSIYNTHTGETYRLTDGVERLDGKCGGVVTVAAALQDALENKHGIRVARSEKINDLNYNTSYLESEKTARELLAANPNTRALLDIHRDAEKTREQSVVNIQGAEVAPILLVVGSDARRPFPTWRQNHAFALKLAAKLDEMYPGLSLGVRVKDGLYNQFLHPGAVLVEMGTSNNSTEEAVRSARLLAEALAEVLDGEDTAEKTGLEIE